MVCISKTAETDKKTTLIYLRLGGGSHVCDVILEEKCDNRKVGVNFMPKLWMSFTDDPYGVE